MTHLGKVIYVYWVIKRVLDVVISIIALIVLSPLFLAIITAIKLETPGPAIFKQKRAGLKSKPFYIYKFRTMKTTAPSLTPSRALVDSKKYITKVGSFLRKTSLDELPQIINVIKGEMSIIGPRPLIFVESKILKLRRKKKIDRIYPGITGLAQINGRDTLDIYEKIAYDEYYLKHLSFFLDLKIFIITIFKVVRKDNVVEGCTKDSMRTTEKNNNRIRMEKLG